MFTPYEEQLANDAAVMAVGNEPGEGVVPDYSGTKPGRAIAGVEFPRGRAYNPLAAPYHRIRPLFSNYPTSQHVSGISSISAPMAQAAKAHINRTTTKDPEQSVIVDNRPAEIRPAVIHTSVSHRDIPLDRARVERVFEHHTQRGFAF
jgi:hypothetical protein